MLYDIIIVYLCLIVALWRNGFIKKYNVIVVFDKNMEKTLMCKRTKEPYMGMYNLVGGKIEKDNDGLNEAYRELYEETNISYKDI